MYSCKKCGKQFKKPLSLNAHLSHCGKNRDYSSCAWNKGKNKFNTPSIARAGKKISKALTGKSKGIASTPEKETLRRMRISETAKKNGLSGGYRKRSGRGKKGWYNSIVAGRVFLDSSYELRLAKLLDKYEINWIKNKKRFNYIFKKQEHKYIPDFYLKDENFYIETKGFKREVDEAKWSQFPFELMVLYGKDLDILEGRYR